MILPIEDLTQVAATRRTAVELAQAAGLDESQIGRVALVVTEMSTNLLKHAGGGTIILGSYTVSTGKGIEVIALDKGAGIANVSRALNDGYSTAGTVGGGFGIMQRQSERFEIFSSPGHGTVVVARIGNPLPNSPVFEVGVISEPYPGEEVCGDGWAVADVPAGP